MGQFSREAKFAYGFLFASLGVPYLIDKWFGALPALIAAVLCVVVAVVFLISAHIHKDGQPTHRRGAMATIGMFALVGGLIGLITGAISGSVWVLFRPHNENPVQLGAQTGLSGSTNNTAAPPERQAPVPATPTPQPPPTRESSRPTLPPLSEGLSATVRQIPSWKNDAPIALEVTIQVQADVAPFGMDFIISKPLVDGQVLGGPFNEWRSGTLDEALDRSYWFYFESPPVTPRKPLVVVLFAKETFEIVISRRRVGLPGPSVLAPNPAEIERRRGLLRALSREYVLSHDGISPGLMAGTEWPPLDWVNQRLEALGESWTVTSGRNSMELLFVEKKK